MKSTGKSNTRVKGDACWGGFGGVDRVASQPPFREPSPPPPPPQQDENTEQIKIPSVFQGV